MVMLVDQHGHARLAGYSVPFTAIMVILTDLCIQQGSAQSGRNDNRKCVQTWWALFVCLRPVTFGKSSKVTLRELQCFLIIHFTTVEEWYNNSQLCGRFMSQNQTSENKNNAFSSGLRHDISYTHQWQPIQYTAQNNLFISHKSHSDRSCTKILEDILHKKLPPQQNAIRPHGTA